MSSVIRQIKGLRDAFTRQRRSGLTTTLTQVAAQVPDAVILVPTEAAASQLLKRSPTLSLRDVVSIERFIMGKDSGQQVLIDNHTALKLCEDVEALVLNYDLTIGRLRRELKDQEASYRTIIRSHEQRVEVRRIQIEQLRHELLEANIKANAKKITHIKVKRRR